MNRALWHVSDSRSELREVEAPVRRGLETVTAVTSMISTGTERLVALGLAGGPDDAVGAPGVEGSFRFPIKYGYSLVGHDGEGRLVHCLHPHQQIAYVPPDALHELPEGLDAARGALLSNMETVLTGIWDAEPADGSDVLVCGFGNVGALLANTLRLRGRNRLLVAETDTWRLQKARDLGFGAERPDAVVDDFACIFDTSGSPAGLQFCIDHCAMDGTVAVISWFGRRPVSLDLGRSFHRNRVRLVSSQVSSIPAHLGDRVTHLNRKQLAVDYLLDESFGVLLTNRVAFDRAPAFYERLRAGEQGDGLIWLLDY